MAWTIRCSLRITIIIENNEVKSIKGRVINKIQGYYYVDTGIEKLECKLRGTLKMSNKKDNCIVGDIVEVEDGAIYKIHERENILYRPLVSNLSSIVITFSGKDPNFDMTRFNLMLLNANFYRIKPLVLINKIELFTEDELINFKKKLEFLKDLDIDVIYTSTKENINIDKLEAFLKDKLCALGGPSGVGKSSLINMLQKDIVLVTGETSKKISRGKHTTKGTTLLNLNVGGYIIDTPGFSSLELPPIKNQDDLLILFPEFTGYTCKFNDCIHINEPNCGVKRAFEEGKISKVRYEFYVNTYNKLKLERWNKYD